MYRKILIGGVTAAAIVGAGGAALALGGDAATTGSPALSTSGVQELALDRHPALRDEVLRALRHVVHGEAVTRGSDGYVTHHLIVGHVLAVSSNSITVRASDGTTQSYTVTSATRVRVLGDLTPGLTTIDKISLGDRAAVAGTGTNTLTAKHVVKLLPR